MAKGTHTYSCTIEWTGNTGTGTSGYKLFGRDHVIRAAGKPDIAGSSDPAFRGDASRYNPEDMLVASLSTCHMLWYLHLASDAGVIVTAYSDAPIGTMVEDAKRGGFFTGVVLHPAVTIAAGSDAETAKALHERAHHFCFIANSVNFPVTCEPVVTIA
jgi:organic hydroperoxide reductase OsmC/OhrA